MRSVFISAALLTALSLSSALAQTPPAPPAAPAPAAAPIQEAVVAGKRDLCRQDVSAKGLRGEARRDQMQLCMAQGQLECVQKAIDQKISGPQRKDFMKTCMGRS